MNPWVWEQLAGGDRRTAQPYRNPDAGRTSYSGGTFGSDGGRSSITTRGVGPADAMKDPAGYRDAQYQLYAGEGSSDPGKDADAAVMRMLGYDLMNQQGPDPQTAIKAFRQNAGMQLQQAGRGLTSGFAGRGMLNSGAAAAGLGSMYGQGSAAINQFAAGYERDLGRDALDRRMAAAQLIGGLPQRSATVGEQALGGVGDVLGGLLSLAPSLFGMGGLFGKKA